MKYLLSLIAAVLLFSCQTQKTNSKYAVIEYEAGACFGFCPIYKMTIQSDRTAVLEAEHFNFNKSNSKDEFSKPREGTFTATINQADYDRLVSMLNDINVNSLNDKYGSRNVSDMPTSYLRIKLNDGNSKNVEDYGKAGSEKLKNLYAYFESLKTSQKWTKIK